MSRVARVGWTLAGWVAAALATALLLAYLGQRSLIYHPDPAAGPPTIGESHSNVRDVSLRTEDALTLGAWLVEPSGVDVGVAALYLPGNAGSRHDRLEMAQELATRGITVLLVDYRGFGGNPGEPGEGGFARDARSAAAWLRDNGFPADRTIYVGESIGTGVATTLAVSDPPAGILLRSPYTSLSAVVRDQIKVPVGFLLKDRFDTLGRIGSVEAPTLVLAGEADELIAVEQSATVAAAAGNLHDFVTVPGAGHNDDRWFGVLLADHAADFVRAVAPPAPSRSALPS